MMFKRYKFCISIIIIFFTINSSIKVYAQEKLKSKAIIIYDRENIYGYNVNILNSIKELLGGFNTDVVTEKVDNYKKHDIDGYDYVFVLGIEGNLNNNIFFEDLKVYNKKICWIGRGINYYTQYNNSLNFSYLDKKLDVTSIYYTNKRDELSLNKMNKFSIESKYDFPLVKVNGEDVITYSYLSDGKEYCPYIIRDKNFYYISRIYYNSVTFYIFSDLLNDIFEVENINKGKVFVRIEDVHPFRDLNELKNISDYLYSNDIPFMIALIPTYVDTKNGHITTLSEKKDFVDVIKYMQDHGGTVILHGYTHQNAQGSASGEGFEFWDGVEDKPLSVDMVSYVHERISKGLRDCVNNGIYPLGFEAPHYAIDSRGYKELKKYFSTYVGQFQSSDNKFTTTMYSCELKNTDLFNQFIPENLGFVDPNDDRSVQRIEENFNQVSITRGYTAGFFFHPYVDIKYLKSIISFFQAQSVDFLDLKKESNWSKCDDVSIWSDNGQISVKAPINNQSTNKDTTGKISQINKFLIIIIAFFCLIFMVIFIVSKKIDRKKFLR